MFLEELWGANISFMDNEAWIISTLSSRSPYLKTNFRNHYSYVLGLLSATNFWFSMLWLLGMQRILNFLFWEKEAPGNPVNHDDIFMYVCRLSSGALDDCLSICVTWLPDLSCHCYHGIGLNQPFKFTRALKFLDSLICLKVSNACNRRFSTFLSTPSAEIGSQMGSNSTCLFYKFFVQFGIPAFRVISIY